MCNLEIENTIKEKKKKLNSFSKWWLTKKQRKKKKVHIFCLINIVGIHCKQPITDCQARNYKIIFFLPLVHLCKSRRIFFKHLFGMSWNCYSDCSSHVCSQIHLHCACFRLIIKQIWGFYAFAHEGMESFNNKNKIYWNQHFWKTFSRP